MWRIVCCAHAVHVLCLVLAPHTHIPRTLQESSLVMTNLPMPGEAQSPANYMKQVRLNAHAHICMHASCHVHVRMQVDHAACICNMHMHMCICVCVWPCRWTRWSTRCRCACSSWARRTPTSSPCTREEALAERRLKRGATCGARPLLRLRLRPRQLATGWLLYHCLRLQNTRSPPVGAAWTCAKRGSLNIFSFGFIKV